jgi:Skp family chaperone for outer membrane proteins
MVVIVAGLMTVGAGLYCGARLLAQAPAPQPAQQQPPAQTRVAVVNLHLVLKGYQKTKVYDQEVEAIIAPMRKQGEDIKENIKKCTEMLEGPKQVAQEHRAAWEKAFRDNKRALEDLEAEASKKVGKKREEQLVQLYKEIEEAVQRYAISQGFTLVLQYTEPEAKVGAGPDERYTAQNIQRKLAGSSQTGCTVPMYFHPGLDISQAVIQNLNAAYPQPVVTPVPNGKG